MLHEIESVDDTLYRKKLINILSKYAERMISNDGSITTKTISDDRFFTNTKWDVPLFHDIFQFQEKCKEMNRKKYLPVQFDFPSENLNLEAKIVAFRKIFDEDWSLSNLLGNQRKHLQLAAKFIQNCHPRLNSFLDFNLSTLTEEWVDWLQKRGTPIMTTSAENARRMAQRGRGYAHKTCLALFLPNLCKWLQKYLDDREEWEKDGWDVRNLEKYGISYNKTALSYYMYFDCIHNLSLREYAKKYIKHKLLNKTFAWNTARMYMSYLPMFFNWVTQMEPSWIDLKDLERKHILEYIVHLDEYIRTRPLPRNANPAQYKNRALTIAHKFLSDMQLFGTEVAPLRDIRTLIFSSDKPKIPKKSYSDTDYIPDIVLDQLFTHINKLRPDAVPIIWIMYKTGLRISDALLLRQDCLIKVNGKYWLEADIEKTYVKGHRIPIDDDLASIVASLISSSRQHSNQFNNPDGFLFARFSGSRRGKPMGQYLIREYLNELAHTQNIRDENGEIYHFTNHAFRHTYAVKLLNNGADIMTIQELMAHASPEMTMRYAKLLDNTKRKVFDLAVEAGLFTFGEGDALIQTDCSKIPSEVLDMLWTNHKLNAMDTPYGTCLQRAKGNCMFAKHPPCLTCNTGKPCKDICIGAFYGDIEKYEVLISSTSTLIEQAGRYERKEMVQENEELLKLYQNIYETIRNGNLIYGRMERLMDGYEKL